MNTTADVITVGVTDLQATRRFYEEGLGCPVEEERDGLVALSLGADSSKLALRPWDALADDAGVSPESSGFRGFTLSYIVDRAAAVDDLLARVAASGGEISKPPKNALWGYSAYVTDPSGHLWKIASAKRRPLFARKRAPVSGDEAKAAAPSEAQEIAITIGVADMKRAKQFYAEGLGCAVKKSYGAKFVSFDGGDGAADLAMYRWDALADDAGVPAAGSGFRGFSLTHIVESAESVEARLDTATRAGGNIAKPALASPRGGRSGYFTDPDGYLWRITSREQAQPPNAAAGRSDPRQQPRHDEREVRHARP